MRVVRKMNVSREAYFDYLLKHLLKDLRKKVNRNIKLRDLVEGFRFEKTYQVKKGKFVSRQELEIMRYGEMYCLKLEIPGGIQRISHTIHRIDDHTIEVVYEEKISTKNMGINVKRMLKGREARSKMKLILEQIETKIILNSK